MELLGTDVERGSEEMLRRLVDLAARPLDVNAASAAEMAVIPALSLPLARRIARHRTEFGPFPSVAALQSVPGVTPSVYAAAAPYLHVASRPASPRTHSSQPDSPQPDSPWGPIDADLLQQVTRRLDLGRGYTDDTTRTTYTGSPERLVTRLRLRAGRRAEAGLTLDKDPGEAVAWQPAAGQYGADHVSATLALHDAGPVQSVVIGDYDVAFGQGAILWPGGAFGKGRDPVGPLLRSGNGIQARSSTEENDFFRGAALTATPFSGLLAPLSVSGWASRKRRDASTVVETAPATGEPRRAIASLSSGGYHRTEAELARKNAVRETNTGAALVWRRASWHVGVAGMRSRFDLPFAASAAPSRRFAPAGSRFGVASLFGDVTAGDVHLFGEAARSASGRWGGVGGLSLADRRTETLLFARWYPRSFWSLHGQALGESGSAPQNEAGVYAGVRSQVARSWHVAAYADAYRFPWVRRTVPRPSTGIDARLVIEHRPRPWLHHYLQFRTDRREVGAGVTGEDGRVVDGLGRETRSSVRWHGRFVFSSALTLRTRLEAVRAHSALPSDLRTSGRGPAQEDLPTQPVRHGLLLYQDLRWSPASFLTAEARLAFFDTDDYATRVFAYEYDLLYSFSVPALQGRGQRSYLLVRARPFPRWTVEAKAGVTRYRGVRSVGSGLDETPGSRLRELRLQVRWRLR